MSEDAPKPSLVFASAQFVIARAYFAVLSYVVIVLLARWLGREVFGQYVVVMAVLVWVEVVTTGLTVLLVNRMARSMLGEVRGILVRQRILAVGAAAGMLIFAGPLASLFHDASLAPLFRAAALDVIPYTLFIANQGLLNGLEQYRRQFIANLVYPTAKLVLMGGFLLIFAHPAAAFIGMALSSTIAWLVGLTFLHEQATRETMARMRAAPPAHPREIGTTLIVMGSQAIFFSLDIWFLQFTGMGAAVLGEYGAAQNLAKILQMGVVSMAGPMIPAFARAGNVRKALAEDKQLRRVVQWTLGGLIAGAVILAGAAPWLIRLMFGAAFHESAGFLRWLAVGYGLLVPGLIVLSLLYHTRRGVISAALAVAGALLYPVLALALTARLGPGGAGAALGIVGLFFLIAGPLIGRRFRQDDARPQTQDPG